MLEQAPVMKHKMSGTVQSKQALRVFLIEIIGLPHVLQSPYVLRHSDTNFVLPMPKTELKKKFSI